MNCIDWMSKRSNNLKLQNQLIYNDLQIIRQNDQNKAKLQKWSKSNDLHRFYVKTIKMLKTTQNYKTDQITMICIDWMVTRKSKTIKSKHRTSKLKNVELRRKTTKTTNQSNFIELHRLDGKTIKTKLKLNYKSDRNPMTCIDFTSKR